MSGIFAVNRGGPNTLSRCKPLLGTFVEVSLWGSASDDTLIAVSDAAFAEIERVEASMSFHRTDSELSYLNRCAFRQPCRVSAQTAEVLQQALDLSRLSGGLFDIGIAPVLIAQRLLPDIGLRGDECGCWSDIRVCGDQVSFAKPLLLDLGGIAKGYAVDRALAAIDKLKESEPDKTIEVLVNAGGDLRVSRWWDYSVNIRHPAVERGRLLSLRMRAPALATSAHYFVRREQGARAAIICPKTRTAVSGDYSVSVFAPTCMLADALTKVVHLKPDCDELLRSLAAQAVILDQQGRATWVGNFQSDVECRMPDQDGNKLSWR